MNTELRVLVMLLPLLAACDKGTTDLGEFADSACPMNEPDDLDPSGDEPGPGTGEVVPLAVDCSLHWGGVTETHRFEAAAALDDDPTPIAMGPLLVRATLFDDPYESRSFSITIYREDGGVGSTVLYQMDRTRLPQNEFLGDHGFTGLNWVKDPQSGGTLQYGCFARDPSDPIRGWED